MELWSSLFWLFFCLLYFFLPPFEDLGCFSGCLMSSAGIQTLFCGIYSTFKCSFDEFVGEKVFSPSYSSAILAPPPWVSSYPPGHPVLSIDKPPPIAISRRLPRAWGRAYLQSAASPCSGQNPEDLSYLRESSLIASVPVGGWTSPCLSVQERSSQWPLCSWRRQ